MQKLLPPARSAAKSKAKPSGTPVELIGTDVQFVRRYAAMHGKVKSQAQVLALIHALQKAILERRIRKESPYAKEIGQMQEQLIRLYEKMGEMAEIQIEAKNLKRYQEIGSSQTNMPSINLLKAYVRLILFSSTPSPKLEYISHSSKHCVKTTRAHHLFSSTTLRKRVVSGAKMPMRMRSM